MNKKISYYHKFIILVFFIVTSNTAYADYPNTSVGVIDINLILSESKAAKDAAIKIEDIAISIEEEISKNDQELLKEQNLLIESQAVMAPEAFDLKRKEYEKKIENYNSERQEKLLSIDMLVGKSRNEVLNELKPILEEIANKKGITVLLEKNSVILNADNMDITSEAIEMLDKKLPKIDISLD